MKLFTKILVFRIIYALITITSFAPDEYYQTVEQAYKIIYRTDISSTWEWWPNNKLRSYVLILPYIILFRLAKILVIKLSVLKIIKTYFG